MCYMDTLHLSEAAQKRFYVYQLGGFIFAVALNMNSKASFFISIKGLASCTHVYNIINTMEASHHDHHVHVHVSCKTAIFSSNST